jgi:lipopolysaccharide/colanic/teichoic acid biosynthesis glycosyltransferase
MVAKHKPYGTYEKCLKRPLDLLCGLAAVVVFWWLYLIVALLVRVKLGSPVLFMQERPGKDEKIFKLYKFRTMTDARDENGELLPDEVRLTKFGRFLRSTSLDELPEAFNIIKGDMSVIGPRPLLVKYLPYYTEEERKRHVVRPGLSGWAQVNGRNAIDSWEQRFQYDLEYVNNVSFLFDVKVVLMTVVKVIKRSDIQVGNQIKVGRLDVARRDIQNDSNN